MSQRFCHHVNQAGVFCGGPPLNDRDYCFWHMHETGRRMKAARARARSERVFIQLPILDDLHAVQVGLMQLAEAVAHGEIDYQSGRLLLSVLRVAASNLKSAQGWCQREQADTFGVDAAIVAEDPGFERQYGLPKDFNLSVAPEVAFPPPAQPSVAAARDEQADQHHTRRTRNHDDSHWAKQNRKQPYPRPSPEVSPTSPAEATVPASRVAGETRKPPRSGGGIGTSTIAAKVSGGQ